MLSAKLRAVRPYILTMKHWHHSPANERLPSGVSRWLRNVKLLNWCRVDPIVMGYVSSLLACRLARSVSMDGKFRVYQKTSQFANEIAASES